MAFRWYCDLVMQHSLSWYRDIVTSDCCHQNLKMAFRSDFWEAWSKEALLLAEIRFCRPTSYQQQRNIVKTMYSFSGPTWRKRTQRSWSWGRRGWRSWCWRRTRSVDASVLAYQQGIVLDISMRFEFWWCWRWYWCQCAGISARHCAGHFYEVRIWMMLIFILMLILMPVC